MAELSSKKPGWLGMRATDLALVGLLVILIALFFYFRMFFSVYSGEAAVVWDRFAGGTRIDVVYGEGMHIILPWNQFYKYDVRLQSMTDNYDVLLQNGLPIEVTASVRFRPAGAPFQHSLNPGGENSLGELHRRIGPNYAKTMVLPLVGSALREVLAKHTAEEVYRQQRQAIQDEIVTVIANRRENQKFADERTVDIIDVLILGIKMPETVRQSIEEKMAAEQAMLTYDFTVRKEQREAERKRIEAEGIRRFQEITAPGITPGLLQWKGIEATLELARSQNAKIIVIGGKEGLPLMLSVPTGNAGSLALPPVARHRHR